jgi:glycosyltransferase involved in cell wall biosynthesis
MLGSEWFADRPGGLNRYFDSLYTALRAADVADLRAGAFGSALPGAESLGPVDMGMAHRLRASWAWGRRVDEGLVDFHFAMYAWAALRGRRPQRYIVHFQGPWASESRVAGQGRFRAQIKFRMERAVLNGAERVIVLSNHFADLLVRHYSIPAGRISIIPGGVDTAAFVPGDPPPRAAGRMVVSVRRLEERMGLDILLRAWPQVLARYPDSRLLIIGDGSSRAKLERLVADLHLGASVTLAGLQSDAYVLRAYQEADVSVVPSVALEGFGLIALESLACGTPAVVTNCGGLPGIVEPLSPNLVTEIRDVDALGKTIVLALDGDRPSGAECREWAERFSWDRIAAAHVDLYRALQ